MKPQPTQPAASQRLLSLDALRGFDMLFIMGFAGLVTALCKLCPGEFSDWMTAQMGHADWNGFFHHDTIFPLFLFIAGISFPFSLFDMSKEQWVAWILKVYILKPFYFHMMLKGRDF